MYCFVVVYYFVFNKVECLNVVGVFIDWGYMYVVCLLGGVGFFDKFYVVMDLNV